MKYEGGGGQIDPSQEKLPSKSPALLGLNIKISQSRAVPPKNF